MALSTSQKVVIAKEGTYATAAATSTDDTINSALPVETANVNLIIDPFNDQSKKGTAALDNNVYPTVRRAEGSIEGPFFTDECAFFLLALLGKDAVTTAASNQNTHTFTAKTSFATPDANSLTIDVRDDTQDLSYRGCYVSSLTLRYSAAEGILTYSANIIGADQDTSANLTNNAFNEPVPVFGWTGTYDDLTGSLTADNEPGTLTSTAGLIDAEITINRPTALTYVFRNSSGVYRADPGPLEVTARFTMDWDDGVSADISPTTWLARYRNGTNFGCAFHLTNNQSAAAARMFRIYLPAVYVLDGPLEIDRSDTAMRFNISARAVNNTNAAITGPCRVKVTSRKTAVYGS